MKDWIRCSKCNNVWALAKFDGIPLCTDCLVTILGTRPSPTRLTRIRPLKSIERKMSEIHTLRLKFEKTPID